MNKISKQYLLRFSRTPYWLLPTSLLLALTVVTASAQTTTTYSYDSMGRLTGSANNGAASTTSTSYQFDRAGNRARVTVSSPEQTLDGSFENLRISGYQYTPAASALRFVGLAGIAENGGAWGFPSPWQGTQVAFVQSANGQTGSVELTAVNLTPGRTYQFAFAVAQRPGFPANRMNVFVNDVLAWDNTPPSATQFTPYPTSSFVASSTTAKIRFSSTATSYDSASGIDSVSVQRLN